MENKYISLAALSSCMGLPKAYLKRLALNGHIPALKTAKGLRFNLVSVQEALHDISKTGGKIHE